MDFASCDTNHRHVELMPKVSKQIANNDRTYPIFSLGASLLCTHIAKKPRNQLSLLTVYNNRSNDAIRCYSLMPFQ